MKRLTLSDQDYQELIMILNDYNFSKAKEIRRLDVQMTHSRRIEIQMLDALREDLDASIRIAEIVHNESETIPN